MGNNYWIEFLEKSGNKGTLTAVLIESINAIKKHSENETSIFFDRGIGEAIVSIPYERMKKMLHFIETHSYMATDKSNTIIEKNEPVFFKVDDVLAKMDDFEKERNSKTNT